MDASQETISDKIAARRTRAGLTRYELAKRAGIKWETLNDIESGKRKPQRLTLELIERALSESDGGGARP